MRYYILNTQAESNQCLQECYDAFMHNVKNDAYRKITKRWAQEQQRITDGKYIVPVCPQLGTFGYTIETATDDWFPELPE